MKMNDNHSRKQEARAEAAVWVARMHGSERGLTSDPDFQFWYEADEMNREAFSRASEVWELSRGVSRRHKRHSRPRRRLVPALMVACGAGLVIVLGATVALKPDYSTRVGQQETTSLVDGTLIALNTQSAVKVAYSADERRVNLVSGEAMFDVAKNPVRPFVVRAGPYRIRALGTKFVVRHEAKKVSVTLLEGSVQVTGGPAPVILSPGQRLLIDGKRAVKLDAPNLEVVTAWRHGEVQFDNVSVSEAVSEINRYNKTRIIVPDENAARQRVSGVFISGDPITFASTLAELHDFDLVRREDDLILRSKR